MITWQEFELVGVQAVAYTPVHPTFSASRAVSRILAKYAERFNGEMQVLELPIEGQSELPFVVLQNEDKTFRLHMGPARADSFWADKPGKNVGLKVALQDCTDVLYTYLHEMGASANRFALVVSRICFPEHPASKLVDLFCNDASKAGPFRNSQTFEVHNHKTYRAGAGSNVFNLNSWVRCKTAKSPDDRWCILVQQDLNTVPDATDEPVFGVEQAKGFFELSSAEADEIMKIYFPGQAK